jgi:hypothetical protein
MHDHTPKVSHFHAFGCKCFILKKGKKLDKFEARLVDGIFFGSALLMVYIRVKVQVDLQADKSPVVVKGPFFPQVMNPRYRIREQMCDARVDLIKPRNYDLQEVKPMHLILKNIIRTNLIY